MLLPRLSRRQAARLFKQFPAGLNFVHYRKTDEFYDFLPEIR